MLADLRAAFRGERAPGYPLGVLLVTGSGVLFSFTALLFRATESASAWQFLAYRGAGMLVAMTFLALARRPSRPVRRSAFNWQSVVAGALLSSLSMMFILALARTTAALIAFLQSAAPFAGALFGFVLLRERVDGRTWVAMSVAMAGVVIMVGGGLEAGSALGVLFAGAIPLGIGLYNALIRSAPDSDPVVPALVGGAVLVVVAGIVAASTDGLGLGARDSLLAFAAGALLLGLGVPMFNLGHASVPTAQISLLLMTEVVLSPVWVWIWPGEVPTTATLVGGAIILASVIWLAATGHAGRRFWVARR